MLIDSGRIFFAMKEYKSGKVSLGKAAELAGVSLGEMLNLFAEFGIQSNVEYEDYLKSLDTIRKVW